MTQEEKDLLLKDLCARLPYHPQCYCKWLEKAPNGTDGCVQELSTFIIDEIEIMNDQQFKCQICDVKPYLRPMSSMTEEEESRYNLIQGLSHWTADDGKIGNYAEAIDWLNEHHFDYRGLIEKGLALEAPKDMYNNKTE